MSLMYRKKKYIRAQTTGDIYDNTILNAHTNMLEIICVVVTKKILACRIDEYHRDGDIHGGSCVSFDS